MLIPWEFVNIQDVYFLYMLCLVRRIGDFENFVWFDFQKRFHKIKYLRIINFITKHGTHIVTNRQKHTEQIIFIDKYRKYMRQIFLNDKIKRVNNCH